MVDEKPGQRPLGAGYNGTVKSNNTGLHQIALS